MAKEFKGARLRGIRALRGITQQSLAEKLNRSQTYISHCENSTISPSEGDIWALSRILNCSPEQLLEDVEVKG
jgi:transcriptional regulator with XRE-family HTH domain